jgi:serine O-acetyltransferase
VAACKAVNKVVWHTIYNVHISSDASIGPGLYLIHPRDIFSPAIQVGENFTVFHEVTIGSNGHPPKCPKIGNNVVIYVGARVLGGLEVGDGAKIGANCVVTRSVRPGSSVLPPPNRILPPTAAAAFGQKDFWGEDE